MADLKPGDYIGLYLDNILIHTGVLKDQGTMESGRKIYQVLLVKNIFQLIARHPHHRFTEKQPLQM